MTTTSNPSAMPVAADRKSGASQWLPLPLDVLLLCLALLLMYSPTLYTLLGTTDAALWQKGEHSHGPIMAAVSSWLLFKRWCEFNESASISPVAPKGQTWAWPCFVFGAFWYVVGRSLGIIYFEVGSFIPMLMGVILLVGGWSLLNAVKFPLFFFVFMVPLPGFVIDPINQFIKLKISTITTKFL